MKKILFCLRDMDMGGTEKALLSLLSIMDLDEYYVTIALINDKGKLIADIPQKCNIKKLNLSEIEVLDLTRGGAAANIKHYIKCGNFFRAAKIYLKKVTGDCIAELNTKWKDIHCLEDEYDIAIAYTMHVPFLIKYVAQKVRAKKKYAFIHNDFHTTGLNIKRLRKQLDVFNNIYAVSQVLKNEFTEIFPEFKEKSSVLYNVLPLQEIKDKAMLFFPQEYKENSFIKICSVGRLNHQKGFDMAINVAHKLKSNNIQFCWYIVGGGELHDKLNEQIQRLGVQDNIKLVGMKENPYPYMNYCDIYCQPSRHEGFCTTTNEAKVLNKPILTTDVAGAREQFVHGETGIITEINEESIYAGLKDLIADKKLMEKLIKNLSAFSVDNTEIKKIFNV